MNSSVIQDEDVRDERDQVMLLAYKLWEQRGCPIGSPEADWMQAETIVLRGDAKTTPAPLAAAAVA